MTDELGKILTRLLLQDIGRRMPSASRTLVAILTANDAGLASASNELIEEAVNDPPAATALLVASLSFAVQALAELARATDQEPGEILQRAASRLAN